MSESKLHVKLYTLYASKNVHHILSSWSEFESQITRYSHPIIMAFRAALQQADNFLTLKHTLIVEFNSHPMWRTTGRGGKMIYTWNLWWPHFQYHHKFKFNLRDHFIDIYTLSLCIFPLGASLDSFIWCDIFNHVPWCRDWHTYIKDITYMNNVTRWEDTDW